MNFFSLGSAKVKESISDYNESKMMKSTPIAKVAPELKQYAETTGITKTCAVLGCENSKNLSSEEFFRFPEDPELRQIWTSLTGRSNWTPTDYSYICVQHFSVDCFYCNSQNEVVLTNKAVPSLKLPRHVLEVEYIEEEEEEEEYLDNDGGVSMESEYNTEYIDDHREQEQIRETNKNQSIKELDAKSETQMKSKEVNVDLLKLFTEVQQLQRRAVKINARMKLNEKIYNRQSRFLNRLKEIIEIKKKLLDQKKKKRARVLLSIQDKIKQDNTGLVMAMPMRYTDDLKNFALTMYKYSPQAYIYIRNTLRTLLPSTDVLENWIDSGFNPKNVLTSGNMIRVVAEQTETELNCKVSLN